ncbi:hypothetical protein N0V85_004883 [Neurospora sp. IMI 360204]|nr:hypothetical protein N0V85_004883 [Neurospora sp. IMI 360204]
MDPMEGGGTPSASGSRPVLPAISPAPSTTAGGNRPTSASASQPTPSTSSSGPPTGPPTSQAVSKRKRGLGLVTPTACTECRKKRAKVCQLAGLWTLGPVRRREALWPM